MKESDRTPPSELPAQVGLRKAIELNQQIRRSEGPISLTPSVEVPEEFTKPVFEKVLERFESYINPDHLERFPLVTNSRLAEIPMSWKYGYYRPDLGDFEPMRLFMEFGTEWLAQVAFERDPYGENSYLGAVNDQIRRKDFSSAENLLLIGFINAVADGSISKDAMTDIFAKILLRGDTGPIENAKLVMPDGSEVELDIFKKDLRKKQFPDSLKIAKNNMPMINSLAEPLVKAAVYAGQIYYRLRKVGGGVSVPGIINLSVKTPYGVELAHEYIHTLEYHEKDFAGVPIDGYILRDL